MHYKLKKPCGNCPFRKDLPAQLKGWLGQSRAEELVREVLVMGNTFPCHKTTHHNGDGEYEYTDGESQCAGAAIIQIKDNNPSQWMQIATRMGWDKSLGFKELELDSPVFDSHADFIAFHTDLE